MQIAAIQPKIDASRVAPENLANNQALTENQKIGEASRQFESILLLVQQREHFAVLFQLFAEGFNQIG